MATKLLSGEVSFDKFLITVREERGAGGFRVAQLAPTSSTGAQVALAMVIGVVDRRPDDLGRYNDAAKRLVLHVDAAKFDRYCDLIRTGGTKKIRWWSDNNGNLAIVDFLAGDPGILKQMEQAEDEFAKLSDTTRMWIEAGVDSSVSV